jgi:hypothetical protein
VHFCCCGLLLLFESIRYVNCRMEIGLLRPLCKKTKK